MTEIKSQEQEASPAYRRKKDSNRDRKAKDREKDRENEGDLTKRGYII
ncbi:MAG: hypothetical protein IJ860_02675 [Eubacterium sp.]|nr:hypothetical protein [Eubacterium sp.]